MRLLLILVLLFTESACRPASGPVARQTAIPGPSGIAGVVTVQDGTTAAGAHVYAYRNPKGGLRGPADFEALVDAEGRYFLDLVEGEYHLVARLRQGGSDAGPPRPGDIWAVFPRNPVHVTQGMTSRADFALRRASQQIFLKEGSLASGETGYSGEIVDEHGRPVAGAIALAYRTADHRRMPDYTAAPTGGDGRFVLYLPQGGRFCLAARSRTRGQPAAGEPYGVLAPGEDGCRSVERGVILEVGTIVLRPYRR